MPHFALPALLVPHGLLRLLALAALGWALLTGGLFHLLLAVAVVALLTVSGGMLRRRGREIAGASGSAGAAGPVKAGAAAEAAPIHPVEQDGVLGIGNRSALERRLDEEWRRERRDGEPTALLLIAVDDFAALSEPGSQLAGDVALLTLARSLARMLPRRADLLARYDSSSFAVLLPGTDLPGTLRVAARLRWAIVRLGIAHPRAESGFLSASIGIGVQHGLLAGGSEALLAAAERALRKAQSQGPDRLEYTEIEGKDRHEPQPLLDLPAIRAWTGDREPLQQSPQV